MDSGRNIIHGSSMFRREAYELVGGYEKTNLPEDYNLFQRILKNGFIAKKAVNTNLEYRQHSPNQVNNTVSLINQRNLYRSLYLTDKNYKNTYYYKIPFYLYKFSKKSFSDKLTAIKKVFKKTLKRILSN